MIDAHRDIRGLLRDEITDVIFVNIREANLREDAADECIVVRLIVRGDFAHDRDLIILDHGFSSDSAHLIMLENVSYDCVRNLIADFVRMSV